MLHPAPRSCPFACTVVTRSALGNHMKYAARILFTCRPALVNNRCCTSSPRNTCADQSTNHHVASPQLGRWQNCAIQHNRNRRRSSLPHRITRRKVSGCRTHRSPQRAHVLHQPLLHLLRHLPHCVCVWFGWDAPIHLPTICHCGIPTAFHLGYH